MLRTERRSGYAVTLDVEPGTKRHVSREAER